MKRPSSRLALTPANPLVCPYCQQVMPYGMAACRGCHAEVTYGMPSARVLAILLVGMGLGIGVALVLDPFESAWLVGLDAGLLVAAGALYALYMRYEGCAVFRGRYRTRV